MSDIKNDLKRKQTKMLEKLRTGEFIAKAEPPASSHGSFWEQLLRIKCSILMIRNF